ncbi:hypothetical protein C5167_022392 [Papaver somniferum]|uniref:Uncharacterized protein n=1 Tax=Papaver somniferum TaxID=3469 RepID=A0A4Y7JHU5_PAPSO|nr:hypothetical protein C5167_022392 [Papaver somniferum]
MRGNQIVSLPPRHFSMLSKQFHLIQKLERWIAALICKLRELHGRCSLGGGRCKGRKQCRHLHLKTAGVTDNKFG